jgi:acyl-CoA synthetase (AMP-forming)/AMP-acid ligase II
MALSSRTDNLLDIVRSHPACETALIDAASGDSFTYGDFIAAAEQAADDLARGNRLLHFILCSNTPASLIAYLGCLEAGLPVCLLDGTKPPAAHRIIATYAPHVVLSSPDMQPPPGYDRGQTIAGGYVRYEGPGPEDIAIHPDLALLLTTSGSTGDPKLVRLTRRNIVSNALSIAEYLHLNPSERAVQSLPMSYSYGLSVIHSHLAAGGSVVLTPYSFLRPEFWADFDTHKCTSFAGVPHMYETLKRLRFDPAKHTSLRTITQAGGKLGEPFIEWFCTAAQRTEKRFYVMYGQTEATARISYVPPEALPQKIGSIGIAIPGGTLSLATVDDTPGVYELVYSGPNVMMGYADGRDSLCYPDVQQGVLRTGDLARVDDDNFYYITGRLKRFAKLFGKRVNLMDVESAVESRYGLRAAAIDAGGDRLLLLFETRGPLPIDEMIMEVSGNLGIPPNSVRVRSVDELPVTPSGKKDYAAIARL